VSQSAVSRTYKTGASVSPETRRKVLEAAEKLGYRPSFIPQIMLNHRSNLVAVVISYGPNNWGRTEAGTDIVDASATNVDEDTNEAKFHCTTAANCTDFISRPMSTSPAAAGGEFDDLLVWVPQTILFNRLVAAGKLP